MATAGPFPSAGQHPQPPQDRGANPHRAYWGFPTVLRFCRNSEICISDAISTAQRGLYTALY